MEKGKENYKVNRAKFKEKCREQLEKVNKD